MQLLLCPGLAERFLSTLRNISRFLLLSFGMYMAGKGIDRGIK